MKKYFLFSILFSMLIYSIEANEPLPVDVVSDSMQWDDENRIAFAIGNAEAIQGEKKLSADKLIVHLDKKKSNNEVILIEAIGNVIFETKEEIASGEKAKYDLVENNIIIQDNVKLEKNDNIMAGQLLEMDLETGISEIKSKEENDKVRVRFSSNKEIKDNE